MSYFEQLVTDYNSYRETCSELLSGWQPATAVAVKVDRMSETVNEGVLKGALAQLRAVQGWVLLAHERRLFNQQDVGELEGYVLDAELAYEGTSLRIRKLDNEQWLMVKTAVQETNAGDATHLAIPVTHFSADEAVGELQYQQLWCRNDKERLHIEDAVFTGFAGA